MDSLRHQTIRHRSLAHRDLCRGCTEAAGIGSKRTLTKIYEHAPWQSVEELSAVIPGRREAAGPESSNIGISCFSGFRVPAFGRPRNDGGEFFSILLGLIRREPAALHHAAAHDLIRLAGTPALAHTDRAVRLKLTGAPGAPVGAEPRRLLLLCGHATRKQQ